MRRPTATWTSNAAAGHCAATTGSATDAASQPPPLKPPSGRLEGGVRALGAPPVGLGLDRRSPPRRYTFIPPGRAGVFCRLGAPWGAAGALAPPAAHGSRAGFAAEGEDGDGAGWAGAATPQLGAARSPWKVTQEPATRARRPCLRAARECRDQAGVWGRRAPMINRCLAARPRRSGTPGRRGIRPAVTRSRERR
jgi:hypothetical protein